MGLFGALCASVRDVYCGCCVSDRHDGVTLPYSVAQWEDPECVERALKLGGCLGADTKVTSVSCTPFGEEGVLSAMAKVSLTYTGPPGPATIIAKTTPLEFQSRFLARLFHLFENEVEFYRSNMAAKLDVDVPEIYFAHYDPKHARYILAMADVGRPTADQLTGATPEQACLAIENLAKFHSQYFDRCRAEAATPEMAWVTLLDSGDLDVNKLLQGVYDKEVAKTLAELKDPSKFNVPPPANVEAYMNLYRDSGHSAMQVAGEPPLEAAKAGEGGVHTTLIHGDPRLDNFFFSPCMLIDFQLTREAVPETDVAYFLCGGSVTTEVRRAHELCLLRLYHEQMMAKLSPEQAASYPLETCVLMYALKQATVLMQSTTMNWDELSGRGERTIALVRAIFTRAYDACEDWEGLETLRRVLEYRDSDTGTVDWLRLLQPETAKEVMGERGRQVLALAADGPEMTACRTMLAKAQADNKSAAAALSATATADASGDASLQEVSVSIEPQGEHSPLLTQ
jgi:hypothetical protein